MNILQSLILGIIEGITEWLPISSTGHMILANKLMGINESDKFVSMFLVVIQLGAILAVLTMFLRKLNPFSSTKTDLQKKQTYSLWGKIIVACLPAAVLGLLLDNFLNDHFYNYITVAIMLIIYGVLFIFVENRNKKRKPKISNLTELDYKTALFIGAFQVLSLIPGTSRSGATILGAILLGTSRFVAAEFSFFLAVPVMFGASGLKLAKFLKGNHFTTNELIILVVGMVTAYVVSVFIIKFLMEFIKKHDFKAFGYYRIMLGIVVLLFFMLSGAK
ncbi:MAG: undecaprenyl-diphosphate phosphatase [Bacillota bacterium]|nr:undecaprenyl-diphosphate phosphatase [Bacillota bacterium]